MLPPVGTRGRPRVGGLWWWRGRDVGRWAQLPSLDLDSTPGLNVIANVLIVCPCLFFTNRIVFRTREVGDGRSIEVKVGSVPTVLGVNNALNFIFSAGSVPAQFDITCIAQRIACRSEMPRSVGGHGVPQWFAFVVLSGGMFMSEDTRSSCGAALPFGGGRYRSAFKCSPRGVDFSDHCAVTGGAEHLSMFSSAPQGNKVLFSVGFGFRVSKVALFFDTSIVFGFVQTVQLVEEIGDR